jgi:hypothetical protein
MLHTTAARATVPIDEPHDRMALGVHDQGGAMDNTPPGLESAPSGAVTS